MSYRPLALVRLFTLITFLFLIAGCAATRHIANPTSPPPDLGLQASSEDIEVKLHYVIVPDGPGSWVQGAKWNEWVMSIGNLTQSDVTVERISLIDSKGIYVELWFNQPQMLDAASAQSDAAAKLGTHFGRTMALGTAGQFLGLVCPFCAIASSMFVVAAPYSDMYSEAKDREAIEAEIKRRQLPFSFQMIGLSSVTGSIFLPPIPHPKALVMSYRTARGEGQLKIPLENIAITPPPHVAAQQELHPDSQDPVDP